MNRLFSKIMSLLVFCVFSVSLRAMPNELLSVESVVDKVMSIIELGKDYDYIGEAITQYEHAIQCAYQARLAGCDDQIVIAALLHDIGHLCAAKDSEQMDGYGVAHHEDIGADFLKQHGFSDLVAALVGAHVQAKRYLVSRQPDYLQQISPASQETLKRQGGAMTEQEAEAFEKDPLFNEKLTVRRCEENGKTVGVSVSELAEYRQMLVDHLAYNAYNRQ